MSLVKKGSKLYSILHYRCPHCHEGDFFKNNKPYNMKAPGATNDFCPTCERKLLIETGFYFGAMYVTYAFGIAHFVTIWVASIILGLQLEYWVLVLIIVFSLLILTPYYYMLSKIVWANMFIDYKGNNKETTTT